MKSLRLIGEGDRLGAGGGGAVCSTTGADPPGMVC